MNAPLHFGDHGALPHWLRRRAVYAGDDLALLDGDLRLTFSELDTKARALAAVLRREGLGAGDRLATLQESGAAFVVALFASTYLGTVLVPLNGRLTPAELSYELSDAEPRCLVASPQHMQRARTALTLATSEAALLPLCADMKEIPEAAPGGAFLDVRIDLERPFAFVYTSGTTGTPKAAVLTYGNFFYSAVASMVGFGAHAGDRWLACLPLFHVGGLALLLRAVLTGSAVVIVAPFDAARVNAAIEKEQVTAISVVSTMLQRMLDARAGRPYPPSLRLVLLGGGPVPAPLRERALALGVPLLQTYGLTETASQAATQRPGEIAKSPTSAGRPLFFTEIVIDGAQAPGEVGEILVRGPTVSPGYFQRDDETKHAFRDGFLHTGDIGYLDDGGCLTVLARRNDLILCGGENVYPAEVESTLLAHPAVAEAAVYGIEDQAYGQLPAAAVTLQAGMAADAESLKAFAGERLARYKVPVRIDIVTALPRTAYGKLQRFRLSAQLAGGRRRC